MDKNEPPILAPSQHATPQTAGVRTNSRRSPRRRVLKEGKLIFDGWGKCVVDCTIDNLSDGGAHVRVMNSQGIPEEFYLVEATHAVIQRALVAWRTATGMGLKLFAPVEDLAARDAFMRRFMRT